MILFAESSHPALPVTALDRVHSSYFVLVTIVLLAGLVYALYRSGLIGRLVGAIGAAVRGTIRSGLRTWERLFARTPWPIFLAFEALVLGVGAASADYFPALTVVCGLAALMMGVVACLAYMAIDIERYEVERGHKAIHDPMKGQALATHLIRYGDLFGVPLLAAAAFGAVGGFALFNQGLYETVGRNWYALGNDSQSPRFVDFLAYALINLYQLIDVLDLAGTRGFPHFTFVRKAQWPAGILLTAYKTFFTLVLLQQIFASVRQGQALAEAIADFWSPYQPIHERARNSLPRHGIGMVQPLLASLREIPALTQEQRDQLPKVIAGIGPASIPILEGELASPHEGVRAVAAAALGLLHALDALPALAQLTHDPSEFVRQEATAAIGIVGGPGVRTAQKNSRAAVRTTLTGRFGWIFGRRGTAEAHGPTRVELAVAALRGALSDPAAAVRIEAARALGLVGSAAAPAVPELVALLKDPDETVCCRAAEALGAIRDGTAIPALAGELANPSPAIREAAARAIGNFEGAAKVAMSSLVPILQDADENVRRAAGDAIARMGPLTEISTAKIVAGLNSPDTAIRAQAAEALGTIGEGAAGAAPALAAALSNGNDRVRAKAAEALGKIGETAAGAAVPTLVRALRDADNWVSALAAEALGEMGAAAEDAVPALVRSLRHINPLVRANAVEALGNLGTGDPVVRPAIEEAAMRDADGGVRAEAHRALGRIAMPDGRVDRIVLAGLADSEPRVRAAAAETLGTWGTAVGEAPEQLLALLDDANDQVKYQAIRALPRIAGADARAVEALCKRLVEDDSSWIREAAALALGQLGEPATEAGEVLLRTARTGDAAVREAAIRAMAMIRPAEAAEAFVGGMTDANPEVRKVASAGWMKLAAIPEAAIPALVEALRDPEVQVRANAAHALSRLEALPNSAVSLLVDCVADPNDGLRLNAAVALRGETGAMVGDVFHRLIEDSNSRIRILAAEFSLIRDPNDEKATAVVAAALAEPAVRMRQIALDAIAEIGVNGIAFLEAVRRLAAIEEDPSTRARAERLLAILQTDEVAQTHETIVESPNSKLDLMGTRVAAIDG